MNELPPCPFDITDPKNMGRPVKFDIDLFCQLVEQYICADEVGQAMWMLNNLPGWYRDNPPDQVRELRRDLYKAFYGPTDYFNDQHEVRELTSKVITETKEEWDKSFLWMSRGQVVIDLVKKLNEKNEVPHIVEMGGGSFWMVLGMLKYGLKFTYFGESLNPEAMRIARVELEKHGVWMKEPEHVGPNIFIAFEVLEHLWNTEEIPQYAAKQDLSYDYVLLSTPKYCFGGGNLEWKNKDLGHIRTYTPNEFLLYARQHWPNMHWAFLDDHVMTLVGSGEGPLSK